ncbi:hypothetical protein KGO06_00720 [Patescibacteria group bacterium]|nr:hypothetical protein [Patescibacteria group bacterium]
MHATLTTRAVSDITDELTSSGTVSPADLLVFTFGEFGVDDARMLAMLAHRSAEIKYLVIGFDRATVAAQNALLKVVEDAPGGSRFYFCTPQPGAIIPTLRSRSVVERARSRVRDESDELADAFVRADFAERLSMVEKRIKEAERAGDRTALRAFARALVRARPCRETLTAAHLLDENGASPKLILSHLAVALPDARDTLAI